MSSIKKSILIRVRLGFLVALLFAVAIVVKIFYIQFIEGDSWTKLNAQIRLDYKTVKAMRGNIYSDNGSLLATSLPFYRVAFDPSIATDQIFDQGIDSLSILLSSYFKGNSTTEYKRMIEDARVSNRQYMLLSRKRINYQTKKNMSKWPILREGRYRGGIIFEKTGLRYRPFSNLAQRTVGFINENDKGAGLEYSFNDVLKGKNGEVLFQKISGGIWRPIFDANNKKSIDGMDIHSTIDVNLQDVAETSLHQAMKKHNADEGVVVVMEVKTGHIKAISNLTREGHEYYEKFNYAVGGLYEPGSTFKVVTMMALLEQADVELSDSVDTGNGIAVFYKNKVRDPHHGGFGIISVKQAFERSSNVAMAKLLYAHFGTKPSVFLKFVDKLNLSKSMGLQIVGERHPKINRPGDKDWSGITLPWMAYGYGFELTPLHTLALYNAIANDGKMVKPMFVTSISQADKVYESYSTETLVDKVCSSRTLERLRLLLEGVVERGTAKNLKNTNCKIAGKTGTAVILEKGSYTKKYITSFVGYFPAHNPKYSAIVLIKNPKGKQQYGNDVAGPVFKDISDNIYSRDTHMHLPMRKKKILAKGIFPVIKAGRQNEIAMLCNTLGISNHSKSESEWVRASPSGNAVLWTKNVIKKGLVPDVNGMTFRDALFLLEQVGLQVEHTGIGRVLTQSIAPGVKVSAGRKINIRLG